MIEKITTNAPTFMELLTKISDPRDNRGKRHELAFVLACTITAILSGKTYMSEIHRFIRNRITWLKVLFVRPDAKAVSRAQLPNIIAVVVWDELNQDLEAFFNVKIELIDGQWVSIDGKSLKGTISDKEHAHDHERVVTAMTHKTQDILFQRKLSGAKSSEITTVRELLEATNLNSCKVTLDALHTNPTTLGDINMAGGKFLVQVKQNQP